MNEVIEYAARRVMFSRWRKMDGSLTPPSIEYHSTIDECIDACAKSGYSLPDCFLPYFFVCHETNHIELVKIGGLEAVKVSKSKFRAACQAVWDKHKSTQLTLF